MNRPVKKRKTCKRKSIMQEERAIQTYQRDYHEDIKATTQALMMCTIIIIYTN